MAIVFWNRSATSWNESLPGCALWIIFLKAFGFFYCWRKGLMGAVWKGGAPGMVFPVALLPSSLGRSAWCQEQVGSSLFLGFYVLDPLVLVLLTELVWVVESCTATLPLQKVCVSLRLYFGGDSRMNGLRECMSPYTPKPCLLGHIHKLSCLSFHVCETGGIITDRVLRPT